MSETPELNKSITREEMDQAVAEAYRTALIEKGIPEDVVDNVMNDPTVSISEKLHEQGIDDLGISDTLMYFGDNLEDKVGLDTQDVPFLENYGKFSVNGMRDQVWEKFEQVLGQSA